VYRQYTFDLTVSDSTGGAISGATVTLKDKDDNIIFTETTDAFGRISTQTVTRGYYDQAHGNTLQDASPHTLFISKATYITSRTVFTLDKPLDWRIPLKPQLTGDADPSDVLSGRTFYKDDVDTQLVGPYTPPSSGGSVRRTIIKPSPLEDAALTACPALLIHNQQLKHQLKVTHHV